MDELPYNSMINVLAEDMADAIAIAEGFFVEGSLPARTFNPGDMKLGDRGWGEVDGKTVYAKADSDAPIDDHTDGWSALRRQCTAMLTGASSMYSVNNTFIEAAITWTGGDNPGPWCKIVCAKLNVDPTMTLAEWVKGATT
jgi:hypothetical protein